MTDYDRPCGDSCGSGNCSANKCIACTVTQCANHCGDQNYCSLDVVQIGTHEPDPTMDECVDCESFVLKD